jgi:hypothetical protein
MDNITWQRHHALIEKLNASMNAPVIAMPPANTIPDSTRVVYFLTILIP